MMGGNRGLATLLVSLLLLVLAVPVLAGIMMGPGASMMGPGMMWGYGVRGASSTGWAWGLALGLGWLMMAIFWGALIVGGLLLARWAFSADGPSAGGNSDAPAEILRHRYAAGELTREQYQEARWTLER